MAEQRLTLSEMALRRSPEERNRYRQMLGLPIDGAETENSIQEYREFKPQKPRSVYFVRAKDAAAVKIGITYNVANRLKSLQTSSPVLLELVRVIENASLETERELHEQFAAHRLHGEWFSEEILELI